MSILQIQQDPFCTCFLTVALNLNILVACFLVENYRLTKHNLSWNETEKICAKAVTQTQTKRARGNKNGEGVTQIPFPKLSLKLCFINNSDS